MLKPVYPTKDPQGPLKWFLGQIFLIFWHFLYSINFYFVFLCVYGEREINCMLEKLDLEFSLFNVFENSHIGFKSSLSWHKCNPP